MPPKSISNAELKKQVDDQAQQLANVSDGVEQLKATAEQTNQVLDALYAKFCERQDAKEARGGDDPERFDSELEAAEPHGAPMVNPGKYRHAYDAGDGDPNAEQTAGFAPIESLRDEPVIVRSRLVDVESPEFKEKQEMLKFMAQKITIRIDDGNDETAPDKIAIYVNGREWDFIPGNDYTVPRYVAEGLLRARPWNYVNEEYAVGNIQMVRQRSKRTLRHHFQVVHDPAGDRGRQWHKAILAQP